MEGHWKLEIFDPDGTKVKELDFYNALVNPSALTTLIMNDGVPAACTSS